MSAPLISVVIPCHNAASWLPTTLDSALAQTYPDCEVIVINDGSRDDSLEVARAYERRGVRVLDQPNRGAAAARNTGLRHARGAYIQFLDADDQLAPDKIARQLALLASIAATPRTLSSSAWGRFHTDPQTAEFMPRSNWRDLSGVEFLQLHYEDGGMMQPSAWLAPRTLLDQAGPWDESLSLNDDGEYFARVMLATDRIVFCPEARTYYRSGLPTSLSGRRDPRALDSLFRSVDLTVRHLLAADRSTRTRAAVAYAWKQAAFELYPGAPALAQKAELNSRSFGGSARPIPAGRRFHFAARVIGWRLARRFFT